MNLPEAFLARMHTLLGKEYEAYLAAMEEQPLRGIRLNTLKCTAETLLSSFPFALQRAPFSPCSYYYPPEAPKVGALPLHHAGAFYSQEPSASSAVTALNPQPGDRVLDLCAAPGGKSSQIAACLNGEGLLWSNEIVKSRAAVLLSNLERMGVQNAVVSSSRPDVLCPQLAGYFDKVLVDAPCSGEGMFRRRSAGHPGMERGACALLRRAAGCHLGQRRRSAPPRRHSGLLHLHVFSGGERRNGFSFSQPSS